MSAPTRKTTRSRTSLTPSLRLDLKFDRRAPLTDRMLLLLSGANSNLRLERTAEGELTIMAPAGADGSSKNARLTTRLGLWADSNDLGIAFDSSAGFRLPSSAVLSPDASWITLDRWNGLTHDEMIRYAPICPDFAVELMSPSDSLAKIRHKMRQYRDQGARLGWLIDPKRMAVEIYRPGRKVESLSNPPTLSGEDVLPGFVLDLKGILSD